MSLEQTRRWALIETDSKYYTRGLLMTTLDEADAEIAALRAKLAATEAELARFPLCGDHIQWGKSHDGECLGCDCEVAKARLATAEAERDAFDKQASGLFAKANVLRTERDTARAEAARLREKLDRLTVASERVLECEGWGWRHGRGWELLPYQAQINQAVREARAALEER